MSAHWSWDKYRKMIYQPHDHDDLDSIVQDIRQSQVTDRTTANPQPTFTEVKEKFDHAM